MNSSYEHLVEVIIADGGSVDNTRDIVQQISAKDERVKLIDNPEKYQSFALNKMIKIAKGEVFVRADGHCIYGEDYLKNTINVFLETGAKNVGGAQRYVAKNNVQAGTAIAVKSFLGNGGAKYMDEQYEGYADTVFLGCFYTKDLREIGGFNTKNITNQDSELNLRLIEHFGESVYVSPKIKSWYFPRNTYTKLFKQYFRYGRGRFLTKLLHPKVSPTRGLTPFLFIFALIVYMVLDFAVGDNLYFIEFIVFLGALVLFESFRTVISNRNKFKEENWKGEQSPPNVLILGFHAIISILIMQVGHFSGFSYQLIRKIFLRVKGW